MTDPAARPVLFVVDADGEARAATESALVRRFGADYRVLTADSEEAGLDALRRLAHRGDQVALVAAELHLPGIDGIAFLERAQALHRGASRVLLLEMDQYRTRIPFTELETLQRATTLGRIDCFVVKGWVTPEEWLYPQVQEALTAWTTAHRRHHLVYRIVGEQWDPRSHQLRDTMSRNGVPFAFYPRRLGRTATAATRLSRSIRTDSRSHTRHWRRAAGPRRFLDIAHTHGIARKRPARPTILVFSRADRLVGASYTVRPRDCHACHETLAIVLSAGSSSMIRPTWASLEARAAPSRRASRLAAGGAVRR